MRPEIDAYLREHGARYTTEALRRQLIAAGHDPAEVDAALRETEVGRGPQLTETLGARSRFWRLAIGLHLAVLVLVTAWAVTGGYTYAPIVAIVLGLMLLVGLGISGLIGRILLRRTGMSLALLVPAISAIGLGGVCLAAASGTPVQVPARPGTMELHIEPPLSFDGSGAANCYLRDGGFDVSSVDLGDLGDSEGRYVTLSIATAGDPNSRASASGVYRTVNVYIGLLPRVGTKGETAYGSPADATFELDGASDGLTGTLRFAGLVGQLAETPAGPTTGPIPPPISGIVSWTCE